MSPTPLNGRDYRALRRLSDVHNVTLAEVGETCERVPADSLPGLRASGTIERAEERRQPAATAPHSPKKGRR